MTAKNILLMHKHEKHWRLPQTVRWYSNWPYHQSPTKVVVAINLIITHPLSNAKKCTNHFKLNKVTTPRMKKVENENEDVNAWWERVISFKYGKHDFSFTKSVKSGFLTVLLLLLLLFLHSCCVIDRDFSEFTWGWSNRFWEKLYNYIRCYLKIRNCSLNNRVKEILRNASL